MQRQSLGSPNSKLHSTNGGTLMGAKEINLVTGDDQRRKDQPSSPAAADGDHDKSQKPHKSPPPKPEKFVHVIPILTVVCFLILYLSSHDPSQKDLAQFSGFKRLSKSIDSTEVEDSGGFLDVEKSDVLAIRSLRNLQEVGKHGPKSRLHRKIGDF
ncbi:hypothetical protein RHSIM_Rhsim11G0019700 [Rhododendron simsii]|uniref:Uncharacterized protein n=1 Tax=Rhododendron simsii TaxID=118357 RepID=A0A834LAG8_RHOSS|nr:hypothetical protein RHSIM_Rhsim11G0019700 [Rhododendron simsii]